VAAGQAAREVLTNLGNSEPGMMYACIRLRPLPDYQLRPYDRCRSLGRTGRPG
jgi:hypothetical protein